MRNFNDKKETIPHIETRRYLRRAVIPLERTNRVGVEEIDTKEKQVPYRSLQGLTDGYGGLRHIREIIKEYLRLSDTPKELKSRCRDI